MEESDEKLNGVSEKDDNTPETIHLIEPESKGNRPAETLYGVLNRLLAQILFPDPNISPPPSLIRRIKTSFKENAPCLPEASRNSTGSLLLWTRQGSPLRALLVISVGTITFLFLTGVLIFTLFFLAATANAIIISLIMSLAAAGGFLALFFACLTAIYIGALSVAAVVISIVTISTVIAVVIATGWIGFGWTVWLAAKKTVDLTKHSLSMTGSAISAYSSARRVHHHE